jgi:hypothetical protein
MVLEVQPDAVEAHEAGHLVDGSIRIVEADDEGRFVAAELLFYDAGTHGV